MSTFSNICTVDDSAKKVLFLAPNKGYARTVVRNLADTLNRHEIPHTSSNVNSWDTPFLNTAHIALTFLYCDPIEWSGSNFMGVDRVFGKKALLDVLRNKSFTPRQAIPIDTSPLSRYIIKTEVEFDCRVLDNKPKTSYLPEISKVHFNPPMTIVLWEDGTKTTVRCQEDDAYSDEVGLALCIAKKALGNKGNFNNIFRKWVPDEEKPTAEDPMIDLDFSADKFLNDVGDSIKSKLTGIVKKCVDAAKNV